MKPFPNIRPRPATVQREFRGVNRLDSFSIGDAFATETKNLTAADYPALSVRPGYSVLGSGLSNISGLGAWKDTELHSISNGEWKKYSGSAWGSALASGLGTNPASFCNFQGNLSGINLIMANGTAIKRYDGTAVQDLAGAPAGGNFITSYSNRLWMVVGNELRASSLDNPTEWTVYTDDDRSYARDLESPTGETACALVGGLSKLTIGFPNSIHELYGGVPSDFVTKMVVERVGPVNNRCMVTVKGIMYILHSSGLYQYMGGTLPSKAFSSIVQPYFDSMNAAALSVCAIGSDNENLYISIPTGSSTTPNTLIVYNLTYKTWYVWEGIAAQHFTNMKGLMYMAEAAKVLTMGGTSDNGSPIAWQWTSKPFTAQSMAQVIRWMRMWLTVDLSTGSTMTVSLSKLPSGDSDWTEVGTVTASSNIVRKPIYVASGKVPMATQLRFRISGTGPATIHEVAREETAMPLR